MEKRCSKCKEVKQVEKFSDQKSRKDGKRANCKECRKEEGKIYRRSKKGLLSKIYNHQKESSKRRGYNPPNYTLDTFINWALGDAAFNDLHTNWEASGYDKSLTPSVDRKNDYEGYSFKNIQLMTWGENEEKGHRDIKEGRNNKINKTVIQYTKKGEFMKEFHSLREAARVTELDKTGISQCCNNRLKTSGGYKWEFKN